MTSTLSEIDPMLEARLTAVARQLREGRLHRRATWRWFVAALGTALLFALNQEGVLHATPVFSIAGACMIAAVLANGWDGKRSRIDLAEAARLLEQRHPELELALQTALEQRAENGRFNFLQRRVIRRALDHADQHDWDRPDPQIVRWKRWHILAMTTAFAVLAIMVGTRKTTPSSNTSRIFPAGVTGVTITPGDAEVERRSIVVVTARFGGLVPKEVHLIWRGAEGSSHTELMAKSLSDPVFAFSLPALQNDTTYQLSYDSSTSATFKLTVYDLPALVRADASLIYPEYTGLPSRTIAETRRVSAVEGTDLNYSFSFNKPLRRAVLRDAGGAEIELVSTNAERTRFSIGFKIEKSRRFILRLEDQQGRGNRAPEEIRIEALPNKRPDVRLVSPAGDPRVSPIEEVTLRGEVRDDFGLLDYGVAYSFGEAEPQFISMKHDAGRPVEAKYDERLMLETKNVEPGQLVTWFAWADDFGPEGKPRRTSSDLHFAEVRPLDEIFREDESGGASQNQRQGAGQQNLELIELQRQISIAVWKMKQDPPLPEKRKEDLDTLQQSQRGGREQLDRAAAELRDPRQRAAADKAKAHMDRTLEALKQAATNGDNGPLTAAWTHAQGAYQELIKMLPKDTRVAQSNSRSGRGAQRGNQRQLNQLDFKQAENRYETETEAQPMTTPQQREQLQALSKLRELARRQQEVNQRLQELQTALTAARDEAQREEVRRELKRLEEEQRRLLADTDELRERMDRLEPGNQTQQAREQLERTREDMRRSGERLEKGEVSPALAAGARAAEGLDHLKENFRRESANQFSEQMREARKEARELGDQQKAAEQKLDALAKGSGHSLDDSQAREEVARALEEEKAGRERLLNTLRQVAEDSETSEPGLHRRVYDLVRQQGQSEAGSQLQAGAEMLRKGFVPQAEDPVKNAGRELQQLQTGVERAAESVLGDDTAELRYAQQELDDLSKQLQRERPPGSRGPNSEDQSSVRPGQNDKRGPATQRTARGSDESEKDSASEVSESVSGKGDTGSRPEQPPRVARPGQPSSGTGTTPTDAAQEETQNGTGRGRGNGDSRLGRGANPERRAGNGGSGGPMDSLIQELSNERGTAGGGNGPLTGEAFNDWFERLRTVEELTQLPEAQQRLAAARERAEQLRREYKRHAKEPQWNLVESGIAAPLAQARVLLRQELARRENPEALQPVDRDPVPDKYAESVRNYYEALGR